jgi:hypothetical protein
LIAVVALDILHIFLQQKLYRFCAHAHCVYIYRTTEVFSQTPVVRHLKENHLL